MNSLVHSREALVPGGDLSALIAKLETAEGGSRELDALIHVEVANDPNTCVANSVFSFRDGWYCTGADMVCLADPVTTSLDAALALAARVLGEEAALDELFAVLGTAKGGIKKIPLALCAAILKAHASRAVEGGK